MMITATTDTTDPELRTLFSEARTAYEQLTTGRSPPTLTENLDVEDFWEAETKLLNDIPAHIDSYGHIENKELIENVVLWKSSRVISMFRENSAEQIAAVTSQAFQMNSAPDAIAKLSELTGVADSIAGAIIMFANPTRYTVMDPRATKALAELGYWNLDQEATSKHYEEYCLRCHELSDRTGLSLRDVDRALFMLGGEE